MFPSLAPHEVLRSREEDAEAAGERLRQACGASVDTRPSYSITYEDHGTKVVATVGEEGVVAIDDTPPGRRINVFRWADACASPSA